MGNYSWLLKIINGDNTIIDWKLIIPEINFHNNQFYIDIDDSSKISSITDLSDYLNDTKLFGYLNNNYIKSLCKISLHTKFIDNTKDITKYPKMYFEEEGWDRIHFLEFHPGYEDVYWGSYAFDINYHEMEESIKIIKKITDEQKIYEEINLKKKEYMLNLINDKFTNWTIKKFQYSNENNNKDNNQDNISLYTIMELFGIRHEDYLKNPEETKLKLKEIFDK